MKRNNLLNSVSEKLSLHQRKKLYKQAVRVLAVAVVFATVAGLTLPARTLDAQQKKILYCTDTEHTHTDACYQQTLDCRLDEIPSHVHDENCLEETKTLVCTLAVQESHHHTDECYTLSEPSIVCELAQTEGHTHTDGCMVMKPQLACGLEETEGHVHTEECNVEESVLSCGMAEGEGAHTHAEGTCWTMTKSENLICTLVEGEEHTHTDGCYEFVRTDICTLEESTGHIHTDACYTMQIAVGCGIDECAPHAHTGECFTAVFVPECGIEECEAHTHSDGCYTQEKVLVCELTEQEESHTEHTDECYVTEQKYICGLEGFVVETPQPAPENPQRVEDVMALIEALPEIEEVKEAITVLEQEKNYSQRKAVLQQVLPRIQAAYDAFNTLSENDKSFVTNADTLLNTAWLLTVEAVHFHPALETDDAYVENLTFTDVTVTHAVQETITEETEQAEAPAETEVFETEQPEMTEENVVFSSDKVTYSFTVDTNVYADVCYGDSRIKVEFVLPVDETQATFDMESVAWLDNTEGYAPAVTAETRTISGKDKTCQVLTGYILLTAEGENCAVPGTFSADITVLINNIAHGEQLALTASAAMEHNVWSGQCEYHQAEEKLTAVSESLTARNPLSEEEQLANFQAFLEEINALDPDAEDIAEQTEDLRLRILKAFKKGEISQEQYNELIEAIEGDNDEENIVGEMAFGDNYLLFAEEFWANRGGYATPVRKMATYNMLRSSARTMLANVETEYTGEINEPSDKQIFKWGGTTKTTDGVNVSKIIDGTALENVFDITLTVTANESIKEIIEEPDMAVAVVMDISQTMNSDFGDTTRYEAAVVAANQFLENFAKSNTLGVSKVGFVAFNTDAHEIFPLSSCTTTNVDALITEMENDTGDIIYNYHYITNPDGSITVDDHQRFTNIEAGLKRGWDMIKDAPNKNKYIIFLSDGFPTTYIKSGYDGYCTYDNGVPHSSTICKSVNDGIQFTDKVINKDCIYGTSYSDEAAIRARKMATTIKDDKINIFSIGVDIGGQTITRHLPTPGASFSVVDRTSETYELGKPDSADSFKNWLKNSIGSGYYYDSTNSAELEDAYEKIFAEIKRINQESAKADWVANDPMPFSSGMSFVEFIGLYDKDDVLRTIDTNLQHKAGDTENTASFDTSTNAINWDLKTSYADTTSSEINGVTKTVYKYKLKYRVRLKNEVPSIPDEGMMGFFEEGYFNTNNPTTLKYKITETIDGVLQVSDLKTVNFQIPYVQGYLSELQFNKVDIYDKPVVGAEFTLAHNDVLCAHCRGDIYGKTDSATGTVGTVVTRDAVGGLAAGPLVYTTVSKADGTVSFANIPSGHQYILTESQAPAGYAPLDRQYLVTVAYDNQSITVTDLDGNTITEDGKLVVWDGKVVNITSVELPSTGGIGTVMYTAAGAVLTLTATAGAFINKKRKEDED